MKIAAYVLLALLSFLNVTAQTVPTDTIKTENAEFDEDDELLTDPVLLEEVVIHREKLDPEALKQYMILQNRVYKVYPFAKVASERLTILNANMAKLKTAKEKRKYFKIVEDYMENEFTDKLKKLSRKQGQILVKLVYRQTGQTTFDLIKEHKSGWKAFWSSNTAKVFDIDIKARYQPYIVNEDYLIETILVRAFEKGRLTKQDPVVPIDYDHLSDFWRNRAAAQE